IILAEETLDALGLNAVDLSRCDSTQNRVLKRLTSQLVRPFKLLGQAGSLTARPGEEVTVNLPRVDEIKRELLSMPRRAQEPIAAPPPVVEEQTFVPALPLTAEPPAVSPTA